MTDSHTVSYVAEPVNELGDWAVWRVLEAPERPTQRVLVAGPPAVPMGEVAARRYVAFLRRRQR